MTTRHDKPDAIESDPSGSQQAHGQRDDKGQGQNRYIQNQPSQYDRHSQRLTGQQDVRAVARKSSDAGNGTEGETSNKDASPGANRFGEGDPEVIARADDQDE